MTELPRRDHPNWLWLLALTPFAVLMARQWPYGCGLVCGDYAQYYLHANALLHGRSYTDIGYIYTQYNAWIGPPAQPPGFPLTLVPLFALFGPNPTAIKLLLICSAFLFLVLSGLRVVRTDGRMAGAAVVLFTSVALSSMYATDSAMSDLGFCVLVWAFILVADRPGDWTWGRVASLTLLGLGAMSYRTAGVALVPGVILYAIAGRKGWRPIVPALIWICIGALASLRLPVATTVTSNLRLEPSVLLRYMVLNLGTLRSATFEALLYPFPWRTASAAYHVLGLLVIAWGFVRMLRREWRSMSMAVFVAYVAMLLVIPIREQRYVWPLLPMFAWAFYDGLVGLFALRPRWSGTQPQRIALWSCATLALLAAVLVFRRPGRDSLLRHAEVRDLFARVAALPRSPAPRVVFANPRVLTWETGVPAMSSFWASTPDVMAELRRKRISHIVLGDLGMAPVIDTAMRRAVADSASAFSLVYSNPQFTLLSLLPSAPPVTTTSGSAAQSPASAATVGAVPRRSVAADSVSAGRTANARTPR